MGAFLSVSRSLSLLSQCNMKWHGWRRSGTTFWTSSRCPLALAGTFPSRPFFPLALNAFNTKIGLPYPAVLLCQAPTPSPPRGAVQIDAHARQVPSRPRLGGIRQGLQLVRRGRAGDRDTRKGREGENIQLLIMTWHWVVYSPQPVITRSRAGCSGPTYFAHRTGCRFGVGVLRRRQKPPPSAKGALSILPWSFAFHTRPSFTVYYSLLIRIISF